MPEKLSNLVLFSRMQSITISVGHTRHKVKLKCTVEVTKFVMT